MQLNLPICICMCIYIYIYIYRPRHTYIAISIYDGSMFSKLQAISKHSASKVKQPANCRSMALPSKFPHAANFRMLANSPHCNVPSQRFLRQQVIANELAIGATSLIHCPGCCLAQLRPGCCLCQANSSHFRSRAGQLAIGAKPFKVFKCSGPNKPVKVRPPWAIPNHVQALLSTLRHW
jgi:hypothetical protein